MADIIEFKIPKTSTPKVELQVDSDSIAIANHLVDLNENLMPVVKGDPSKQWHGVISIEFNLEDDTQRVSILAAFMYEKHAEDFVNNLSPGQPGGYLPAEIIEIIKESATFKNIITLE